MDNNIFYAPDYKGSKDYTQWEVPTANATGFGAAADDYAERGIDLNEQLIKNKPATFFMRVNSDAMTGAGIFKGDVVIVDRSLEAKNGKIIIAVVDGEMLIRKLEINNGKKQLLAVTNRLSAIDVDDARFSSWGVVTYVIHSV
ncbi:MAG TPA: translesion error-prone DNA polymerase V autoproteolytic subunit [Flavisolibacter sp.]|jgi:DNA polymerase V|nr:translesion error-prone DNA polymerase V autoproteolytic subunit [Flavisolibacter sp.]